MIIFMGNFVMFASMNAPTSLCALCLQTSSWALNHWRIITIKMICNLGPIAATVLWSASEDAYLNTAISVLPNRKKMLRVKNLRNALILYKLKKLSYYYCLWFGCISNKQIRSLTWQKIMQLSKICVNNVWRFHYGVMSGRSKRYRPLYFENRWSRNRSIAHNWFWKCSSAACKWFSTPVLSALNTHPNGNSHCCGMLLSNEVKVKLLLK